MKTFALAALFVSFSSIAACPNLAGTYTSCKSSTAEVSSGSTIAQVSANGVTTYTVTSIDEETGSEIVETVIADGVARTQSQTDDQTGMVITMLTKAACTGTAVVYDAKVTMGPEIFANVRMNISKTGNKLSTTTVGITGGQTINETVVCE